MLIFMRLSSSADFERAYDRMIKQMQAGHGKLIGANSQAKPIKPNQ